MSKPIWPLSSPPFACVRGELRPILLEQIRGMADPPEPDPVEQRSPWRSGDSSDDIDAELASRLTAAALAHLRRDGDDRTIEPIGLTFFGRRSREQPGQPRFIAFDYTAGRGIAVALSLDGAVERVESLQFQPPASQLELQRSIELAAAEPGIAAALTPELVGRSILASARHPDDPAARRRQFHVCFLRRDERLPRITCTVDLTARSVEHVRIHDEKEWRRGC